MLVRFIAHAGISIEEGGYNVLIDPWFSDSTPEHPVIESIGGGFKTIDFQIPRTKENIERYTPDAILISHFHPHHSPVRDIRVLCANSLANKKSISLMYAVPEEAAERSLKERVIPGVLRKGLNPGDEIVIGPFTIKAREHSVPHHLTWHVKSATGSVIHIGDGRMHRDTSIRTFDKAWQELHGVEPSVLFLSSGGHNNQITDKDGSRHILSCGILTPVEAAQVVQAVEPRAAAIIGFYNHSIFKNRLEYILPAAQTEEEFQWAVSWLAPNTYNIRLTPSYTIGIGEPTLEKQCDTYIDS